MPPNSSKISSAGASLDDEAFVRLASRQPMEIFAEWFAAAGAAGIGEPEAMTLATAGADGAPQARTVLLKGFSEEGFVFFTHRGSRKGRCLSENPRAALLFYWEALQRQASAEGPVSALDDERTAAYFNSRPLRSRIGAWASRQSQPVESPAAFAEQMRQAEAKFAGQDPPLPPHWGGFVLSPRRMEFWNAGEFRLHRRLEFRRESEEGAWTRAFLQP